MTRAHQHRAGFAAPYVLRPALIVFAGAPRSGRTTQFETLRSAQEGPSPIFTGTPLFLPAGASPSRQDRAGEALAAGRAVFSDGWEADDALQPDLVLLSGRSFVGPTASWSWPRSAPERIVPLPDGHEGHVGAAVWTALASRRLFAVCSCRLAAA